jgi:hypothetical protein
MTLQELLADYDIKYARLPEWNETAYLELPIIAGGKRTLWFKLHDLGEENPILGWELKDDSRNDWEIYEKKGSE